MLSDSTSGKIETLSPRSTRLWPWAGYFPSLQIENEPRQKRVMVFIDTQNLFYAVKQSFRYTYPNFNPMLLATQVCQMRGWDVSCKNIRLYTGVPREADNARWARFWQAKLAAIGRLGVTVVTRAVRYRTRRIRLPDKSFVTLTVGEEKAIDVRLALDLVRYAYEGEYDIAVVFSQDQDIAEATDEVRRIASEHDRWIKVVSAYPSSRETTNNRGINRTDWLQFNKVLYDKCLDTRDYKKHLIQL